MFYDGFAGPPRISDAIFHACPGTVDCVSINPQDTYIRSPTHVKVFMLPIITDLNLGRFARVVVVGVGLSATSAIAASGFFALCAAGAAQRQVLPLNSLPSCRVIAAYSSYRARKFARQLLERFGHVRWIRYLSGST